MGLQSAIPHPDPLPLGEGESPSRPFHLLDDYLPREENLEERITARLRAICY